MLIIVIDHMVRFSLQFGNPVLASVVNLHVFGLSQTNFDACGEIYGTY